MLGKNFRLLTITLLTLLSTATFAAVHTQYSSTVCSNTPYLFGCDKLTTSGAHSQILPGDSTVTVNLTFGSLKATAYTATIEPGQTYLFGCQKLTADATETNTLQQAGCECDSTVTLTLQVQAPAPTSVTVAYTANIYDGETYLFGCQKLTVAGPYTETFQRVGGGDSIVNLTLNVNPVPVQDVTVAYTANIYDGETYLFGCQKLTVAGPYTETFQRVGGGDSIVNLTLNVNPVPVQDVTVAYTANIYDGETYLFGCQKLTVAGPYTETFQRVGGGDSIVNLTLNVNPVPVQDVTVAYTANIYDGETYLFGCQKLTVAGPYTETFQRVGGGDSIVNLTLNVNPVPVQDVTVAYTANIYDGETYLFGCQKLTVAGPYTETFQRVGGGDSIVNLTLNVNPVPVQKITVEYNTEIEVDQTYLFGCKKYTFTETGLQTLKDSVQAVNGGDSIIIVHLTVSAGGGGQMDTIVGYTASIYTGETYLFGCRKLTTAGVYKDTLQRANVIGDSITVLTLNVVEPSVTVAYTANIYDGETYLFGCQKLTVAGPYTETFQRVGGGDSIVTLTLNVNPLPDVTVGYTATIKQGQTYLFGCQKLTTAGPYTETFQRVAGGDSIVNLTLDVLNTTYGDTTALVCAASFQWYEHNCTSDGDYEHTFVGGNQYGGDSILTLHLTLALPTYGDTTAVACGSFMWYGVEYDASGDYPDLVLTNVAGCDSIVTLHLTINPTYNDTVAAVESCHSYYWAEADTTIMETGNFTHVFQTVKGCDSIITLPVTIYPTYNDTVTAVEECDSYYWTEADTTITETGNFTHVFTSIHGCDSIVTLPVTINYSADTTITAVTECNSYYWAAVDTTITESGNFTHVFQTIHGCDSVVTLPVTIHYSDSTVKPTPTEPICHSYYWAEADTTIINSGTYTHVFQNQYGCDSVVTFTVTINMPYVDTLEVRAYYGWRIIMINRNQINTIPGWSLDSLQADHPEYVTWHQIDLNGNDTEIATGYYYTLASGEPLPTGYQYYAIVSIPAAPDVPCGAFGRTETITIGAAAPAPALVPSLARPGEDIQVINLDPMVETTIRVYSADGILQKTLTSNGDTYCTIKAADAIGFYLVEIISDDMKSTLRYMVK